MLRWNRRLFLLLFLHFALMCSSVPAADRFELVGKITLKDREFSRNALPIVLLEGIRIPFAAHTTADLSGGFKFKNLHPDLFTLVVYISKAGEYRKTVEVSPGLADSQKRIFVDVVFEPDLGSGELTKVSSAQLSVPEKAIKEYMNARKKLGMRDSDGAMAHLKKTVGLAPQFVEAWNMLGTMSYKSGNLPLAESYFREALKHDPDYYPSTVNLGGILMAEGRLEESLPLNAAAVQARPDDALAQSQMGLNYFYLGQFPQAEKYLKEAISLDPGHFSYPQLPLAEIYLRNRDFSSAALELKQFLALHPDADQHPAIKTRIEKIRAQVEAGTPH